MMMVMMMMMIMILMEMPSVTVMKRLGSGQANPLSQGSSDTCQASKDLLPGYQLPVGSFLSVGCGGKPLFSKAILLALQSQYRCLFIGPYFCVDTQWLSLLMAL